jgi:hypothetical protein
MLLTLGLGRMPQGGRWSDDQRRRPYWPLTHKPYSYEVDLEMLPPGAGATGLHEFCVALERVLVREGEAFVRVVPAFSAFNGGAHPAFGWPTERQWGEALREVFGLIPFPCRVEREIRSRGRHRGGSSARRPLS